METINNKVALIYDFDGTLSITDMQNFELIPELGMEVDDFWKESNKWSEKNQADQILGYMYQIKKKANEKDIKLTRKEFNKIGKSIKYFNGVLSWFERINQYGKENGLDVEHYIISAGLEEILEGTEIRKYMKDIFACSFAYDNDGSALWPSRVVNYTTKTQYLYKINKGLAKTDDIGVNKSMPESEKPIPFNRMIFFGDGATDVPSMKTVKQNGGHSIAVYKPNSSMIGKAIQLLNEKRVDFALPADYSEGKELDDTIKIIFKKISAMRDLDILLSNEQKKLKQ